MNVLSTLGKILPPPTYLRMPSVGIDISDTSLKYTQFEPDVRSGQILQLNNWGDIDIPDSVLQRGVVNDVPLLGKVIKEVKDRTGCELVRVSLPEERAYLFETEINLDANPKEIRGLLEFRLEENVPLSPREAFFDYEIVSSKEAAEKHTVLVTVYARQTIMNYSEACKIAGVVPLSFEVEAQAIARASIADNAKGTQMIIDFGKTRTGVGIVHNGSLMYTSTIEIGGKELSAAMRTVLGDVAESELTTLKNTVGLLPSIENKTLHTVILPVIDDIVSEIKTRVQYWNTRVHSRDERNITSIILCGGSVNMRGLPEYVSGSLGIPAARADVWQNVYPEKNIVPEISRPYSYGYATAIGLGLASYTQHHD